MHFFEPQSYHGYVRSVYLGSLLFEQLAFLFTLHQVDLYGPVNDKKLITNNVIRYTSFEMIKE